MTGSLRTEELEYELPGRLIATRPAEPRDSARMLVLRRSSNEIEHRHVRDLPDYLRPGDLLVMNDTSVIPARLLGRRTDTGGRVEGLFLDELRPGRWRMLLRSNGRLRAGQRIELVDASDGPGGAVLQLIDRDGAQWTAEFEGAESAIETLQRLGRTPLPPYIIRTRGEHPEDDARDRAWYQTVYADAAKRNSVAAPTAGLHFTPELLTAVEAVGARRTSVTLHVGPGTFKPVAAETLDGHDMHWERYEVPVETLRILRDREARDRDAGRLLAVGTTTVRTLESLPNPLPRPDAGSVLGRTDLLIAPPHDFRLVDSMLTNFHLPRSTLLALVAAFIGLDRVKAIYREAVAREYRFYSYGDAMLILP